MFNFKDKSPIVITGISLQLPNACTNTKALWNLFLQQQHTIRKLQENERWVWPESIDLKDKHRGIDYGGFLENLSHFDAAFFKISPKEAKLMDPQQRILLQLAWQCIEDAGYNPLSLAGSKTGVFIGSSNVDYQSILLQVPEETGGYLSTGGGHYALANRLSHFFNFAGPSLVIDTASSSSLVALAQAVAALQTNSCTQALVGGINLICTPDNSIAYYEAGMLSPDGRCKSFDCEANGYVRGEGGIVFLLKPLAQAEKDGDAIYALIRAQAVNHSGHTRSLTVPSATAQAELLKTAYAAVDFPVETVNYIETHGSGTAVGDPIEIDGLVQGFKELLSPQAFSTWRCSLGSVKTNLGHLEAASGLAGVLKVVLAMQAKELPATLNHHQLNPGISFDNTPFRIIRQHESWCGVKKNTTAKAAPLRAGVSSFGLGGVNAHVILEEYQAPAPAKIFKKFTNFYTKRKTINKEPAKYLFIFSAQNKEVMLETIDKFINFLPTIPDKLLGNVAFTLQTGRQAMAERLAVTAANTAELAEHLSAYREGRETKGYFTKPLNPSRQKDELPLEKPANDYDMSALAEYWLSGYHINWWQLYAKPYPQRLHLPSYEFLKKEYWVSAHKRATPNIHIPPAMENTICLEKIQDSLRAIMAKIIQIPAEKIENDLQMDELGFDSLSFRELSQQINEKYVINITPALFFEMHTLNDLSAYLLQQLSFKKNSFAEEETSITTGKKDIAIIGMAAEFPQSENITQFWQHLQTNTDLITTFPLTRHSQDLFTDNAQPALELGGFIANEAEFDAQFFKISPFEAELMDPQQRRFIQIVWQALADAGIPVAQLSGSNTGVFVGVMNSDYQNLLVANQVNVSAYTAIGLAHAMIANRLSFLLNIQGPSEAIDTACSSSLVALHRAVTSLQSGECTQAIVGGVNLILAPDQSLAFGQAGMLSPDGHCKTFDTTANGYVRAEGVAALLLKPLQQAIADGNFIHGVIKSSAVNHGGRATSLTAPNAQAQANLIYKAYHQAGIDPRQISYIETHGTGTSLGDPVEINGLKKAFQQLYQEWGYQQFTNKHCALGSVKTNMGHAESAAGLAGVIKVLLAMRHQCLPGLLHFKEMNPFIDLTDSPFYLCQHNQPWPESSSQRFAGVSSFGFGGVNAHVLLADYKNANEPKALAPYSFAKTAFWFQPLDRKAPVEQMLDNAAPAITIKTAIWQTALPRNTLDLAHHQHIVIVIEPSKIVNDISFLTEHNIQYHAWEPSHAKLDKRYQDYALKLLAFCRDRIQNHAQTPIRLQVLVPDDDDTQTYLGLAALLTTAELEHPLFCNQLIQFDEKQPQTELFNLLMVNRSDTEPLIKYQHQQRYIRQWRTQEEEPSLQTPWQTGGVYLITGGAGALGLNLAQEIINAVEKPTLILIGRSALTAALKSKIANLEKMGGIVEYHALSIDNSYQLEALIQQILLQHGTINGVIHAAGILNDEFILKKEPQQLIDVFTPKVTGLLALDEATKHLNLQFFLCFSSFIGIYGNAGQADYAAANAFMDVYMLYRQELVGKGQRRGQSFSINWPLWREGGMSMNAEVIAAFTERLGIVPLPSIDGFTALQQILSGNAGQFLVLAEEKIAVTSTELPVASRDMEAESTNLSELLCGRLQHLFSRFVKIPVERITADTLFRDLGIDSIMVIQLNKEFAKVFGDISKTILYEYQTLSALMSYLLAHHRPACQQWVGQNGQAASPTPNSDSASIKPPKQQEQIKYEPIAIIGLAGRYPDAPDVHEFWQNLKQGRESIREIPPQRWQWQEYFTPETELARQNKSYSKWGGFIDDFAAFDCLFFHISPREAQNIDPQERLFLQCAWEVIEDAGYTRKKLQTYKVGVFAGITKTGFEDHRSLQGIEQGFNPRTSFSSVANRVSYFLNLNGPSIGIDTMCSSSLVAIHLACQQLQNGSCDLAIAGGVNLYLHPANYVFLSQMQMLSKDGRNCSFGAQASGFVPGEGVGAVLLKRLAEAERDGDNILAVIKSSATNHGGLTSGYTVPNVVAQRELIKEALQLADIDPQAVGYIEAHGTGTVLGDPIEVSGLTQAFGFNPGEKPYCALGSVKSNIGHCEAAAGIAGLTKLLLQLKHRQLVPSLNAKEPNPNINFAKTPFYVQQQLTEWRVPSQQARRIGGISSFGAGGTNAHLLIEEYARDRHSANLPGQTVLIIWSSHFAEGLRQYAQKLHRFLVQEWAESTPGPSLINIGYSLSCGREPMTFRAAIIAHNKEDLLTKLQHFPEGENAFISTDTAPSRQITLEEKNALYTQKDLGQAAQAWIDGADIEWNKFYDPAQAQLISLPTAVFAPKRIWFTPQPQVQMPIINPITPAGNPMEMSSINKKTVVLAALDQHSQNPTLHESQNVEPHKDSGEIKEQLIRQLAELLFLEENEIKENEAFVNMGLDSIIGVEWVKKISQVFQVKISATKLYDYPSIIDLSTFIQAQLAKQQPSSLSAPETSIKAKAKVQLAPTPVVPKKEKLPEPAIAATQACTETETPALSNAVSPSQIAIIGISGRYPGADNVYEFWQNLAQGRDSVSVVPANRWDVGSYYDPNPKAKNKVYCNRLGAVAHIDEFDPLFFNLSPHEAECMDPQQRLFLQEAWRVFEDAGYSPQQLKGKKCGTYVGVMQNDYGQMLYEHEQYRGMAQTAMGNSSAIFAARIAYFLNLKGPAIAVDTACSSSLVAAHLACQALNTGEIDMALVGGATLYIGVGGYQRMCDAGMLSAKGKCASFANEADGFVPGEAVATVLLKRLEDAINDGDRIYGVIIGSGINQDGRTNGITAPSVNAQLELQQEVYQRYNINPQSISYIEAHGTGTKLGDPIEIEALASVYNNAGCTRQSCAIGSVKSNLGHTSAAAGLVSLHKVLLSMHHKQLVPSLHFNEPNEHIDFAESPFYVNTKVQPWQTEGQKRRAAINSFGFSGTNAHMVVEEYIPENSQDILDEVGTLQMIPLSAKKPEQLHALVQQLQNFLSIDKTIRLDHLAYTLQTGRQAMKYRVVFLVHSPMELHEALKAFLSAKDSERVIRGETDKNRQILHSLYSDDDFQEGLHRWITKGKFTQLARVWIEGIDFDWTLLYKNKRPQKIALPSYPFAREKYWFSPSLPPTSLPCREQQYESQPIAENTLLATQQWLDAPVSLDSHDSKTDDIYYLLIDTPEDLAQSLKQQSTKISVLKSETRLEPADRAIELFKQSILIVQQLIAAKTTPIALLIVVPHHPENFYYAPLLGLLKTVMQENRDILGKLLELPLKNDFSALNTILQETTIGEDVHVRYTTQEHRQVEHLVALETNLGAHSRVIKEGGVYWLTGGFGGIGRLLISLLMQTVPITVIVSGRSERSKEIEEFSLKGVTLDYIPADVSNPQQVAEAFALIKKRYGKLDGVIHAAGLIRDAFIPKKSMADIDAVLQPKIKGVMNLDRVLQDIHLDFFIFFSSIASITGNIGQADYSGGNAFLDAFSVFRNRQVEAGLRFGKTLSLNWPLWQEGGMQIDKESEAWFERRTGIQALSTPQALSLFIHALQYPCPQLLITQGDINTIRNYLAIKPKQDSYINAEKIEKFSGDTLQQTLVTIFSESLKIDKAVIDIDSDFSEYGLDSILMMGILNKLEERYHLVMDASALIDFPTIKSLADYLLMRFGENQKAQKFQGIENERVKAVKLNNNGHPLTRKIAIISQACRLPQAATLEQFWDNLIHERDVITEPPPDRWDMEQFEHLRRSDSPERHISLGGYLSDIAEFDAAYFGIKEEEAAAIDPQHRIILELTQELFERANYSRARLNETNTGIFIGAKENNYVRNNFQYIPQEFLKHTIVNLIGNMMAARVADFYNLTGVAKTIDTACSSSLVAIHDACQSILSGESELAVAGGIFLLVDPFAHITFSQAKVLSPAGKSYVFDERADGFVLAEGAGLVLLKEYDAALRDGDPILGVILGSAVNNDGKTMGLTVPNQEGQKKVIAQALAKSQIDPALISYYEAHGTGTLLGDPIEIKAAAQVYQKFTNERQYCALGSVKSNIGHTMTAAGVASLIKVLLSMQHQQIPATLNCAKPHPRFQFAESPFYPNTTLNAWKPRSGRRIAAVSSFGFGGTNCHMIIEDLRN